MFKVSDEYKKEINKLGGRSFVSKVVIRDKEYNDDNIIDMSLNESVNPGDNFSLGSVSSNTFEINLIDIDTNVIFEDAIVKPYIGLKLDNKIEYIPLGVFTVDDVAIKDKKVKLECVDNMIKLERAYFSDLKYPCNINSVLKEICKKSNITCNSILPNYSIDEIKGYSFRQSIGVLATLSGCFARFNRVGALEILSYTDAGLRITPDIFLKFETNDKDYIIGKITAKNGDKNFSKGANTEIIIDNPVITEGIVNDLYNKFKDFTYRPYTLSWQGNQAVQAGDRFTILDVNGKEYNTLIMQQKLTYNGGIKSELKASGKTESSDKFDSKGSITQAMENYSIEQANIKKALIQKADIDLLNAIDAKINNLYTQDLTALKANIKDLQSNKISTVEFNSTKAEIQTALIGKANVNELNVAVERVGILEGKTLSVENQLAGNLTAKNFKANSIVAGSAIIAENAIGSSQISSLTVNKLEAGDISTSKFRIISANGSIQIVGNQLLVNRDNINRVVLGEYRKQDNTTDYGLLIRAKDGKTVMFDSEGVHNAGITDGSIDNNKVADNANIAGNKLDINSVIREVNNNGTETIKGTKVTVGDRTLDVELSTQKNTITEHSKALSTQKTSIQALDNALKLKVDNQTFTQSTETIKGNINSLNSDLVKKINTSLNNAKSYADSKKQEAINSASTDATNKANSALNNAKAYTTAQITTTNSNLSKATSEINILKGQISSKVGQTDIDKSISEINFSDVNLIFNSGNFKNTTHWIGNGGVATVEEKDGVSCLKATGSIRHEQIKLDHDTSYIYWCEIMFNADVSVNTITPLHHWLNVDGSAGDSGCYGYEIIEGSGTAKANTWHKIVLKFKTKNKKDFPNDMFLTPFIYKYPMPETFWLKYISLSKGTKFMDGWTPNPLDIDKVIVDNIKVVTDKISDVSTKLTQTKDSLQASVNSLNSTTQTITTNLTNTTNSLNNKEDKNSRVIFARGTGNDYPANSYVKIGNIPISNGQSRGLRIIALDPNTLKQVFLQDYDTYGDGNAIVKFNIKINELNNGNFIIVITSQDASYPLTCKESLQKIGATLYTSDESTYREAYALIGKSKLGKGNGVEMFIPKTANDKRFAEVAVKIDENGNLLGVSKANLQSYSDYVSTKKANTAQSNAVAHADNVAKSKSNEALNNAKAYTNTQITTVNTRVSSAESSINILKGQISTKVSQSDIDRTINNIRVVGSNLLSNTFEFQNLSNWSLAKGPGQNGELNLVDDATFKKVIHVAKPNNQSWFVLGNYPIRTPNNKFEVGKEYTISFMAKANKTLNMWVAFMDGNGLNSVGCNLQMTLNNGWNYYKGTFKATATGNTPELYITMGIGEIWITKIKLAEGNKDNGWSISPYDINKQIQDNIQTVTEKISSVESTLTQKTNNINAAVSSVQSILKTKADGSTVSSMQSQLSSLNIGLNGIRTEVNKKTDKGSIISAINQSAEEVRIDASRIKLNGLTTFASRTGLKAIEIESNNIIFYDWEGSGRKEAVGHIYSTRTSGDSRKPGIAIGNKKGATFDIIYESKDTNDTYMTFDKDNVLGTNVPITINQDISLKGRSFFLDNNKINSIFESTEEIFILKAKHGVKVIDTDTGNTTALLGSDRASFGKWKQNFYYAEFYPGGFNFAGNDGNSVFWLKDGSWDIWTKLGVNMRIQGDLSVRGSKNRIVDTIYGDLKLNAVESTECWFTDIGIEQNRTDNNGDCIIWFDNKFLSTVNARYKYKIDATPLGEFASNGKLTYVRVVEKTEKYFKVRGTPNTLFDWTITAKQKGYERDRLEVMEKAS